MIERLDTTIAPSFEPLSVAEVKDHLRIGWTDDDAWLSAAIIGARKWMEPKTGRALCTQTLRAVFSMNMNRRPRGNLSDYLGRTMRELTFPLPRAVGTVSVITVEIETDLSTWKTLTSSTDYVVDADSEPVAVWLRASALANWMPSGALSTFIGAALPRVRVTYSAGYGGPGAVPYDFRQALLNAVAWLYENRASGAGTPPDSLLAGLDIIYNV